MFICSDSAVRRERDELLALLDIKERNKYEKCHSQSSDDEFSHYSTIEVCLFELHTMTDRECFAPGANKVKVLKRTWVKNSPF